MANDGTRSINKKDRVMYLHVVADKRSGYYARRAKALRTKVDSVIDAYQKTVSWTEEWSLQPRNIKHARIEIGGQVRAYVDLVSGKVCGADREGEIDRAVTVMDKRVYDGAVADEKRARDSRETVYNEAKGYLAAMWSLVMTEIGRGIAELGDEYKPYAVIVERNTTDGCVGLAAQMTYAHQQFSIAPGYNVTINLKTDYSDATYPIVLDVQVDIPTFVVNSATNQKKSNKIIGMLDEHILHTKWTSELAKVALAAVSVDGARTMLDMAVATKKRADAM